jgi:hypothetical protein
MTGDTNKYTLAIDIRIKDPWEDFIGLPHVPI